MWNSKSTYFLCLQGFWQTSGGEIPQPPTYEEAITSTPQSHGTSHDLSSSSSSGRLPSNHHQGYSSVSPDSSSDGSHCRPVNHTHSISYSSDSSAEMQQEEHTQHVEETTQRNPTANSDRGVPSNGGKNNDSRDPASARRALWPKESGVNGENPAVSSKSPSARKFGPSDVPVSVMSGSKEHGAGSAKNKKGSNVVEGPNGPVSQDRNKKILHNLMQRLQANRQGQMSAQRELQTSSPSHSQAAASSQPLPSMYRSPRKPTRDKQGQACSSEADCGQQVQGRQQMDSRRHLIGRQQSHASENGSNELLFKEEHFNQNDRGCDNLGFRNNLEMEGQSLQRNLSRSNGAIAASVGNLQSAEENSNMASAPTRRLAQSLQHLPVSEQSNLARPAAVASLPKTWQSANPLPASRRLGSSTQSVQNVPGNDSRPLPRTLSLSVDQLDASPRRRPFSQIQTGQRSRSCANREQMMSSDGPLPRRSSAEYMAGPGAEEDQGGFLEILSSKIDEDVYV